MPSAAIIDDHSLRDTLLAEPALQLEDRESLVRLAAQVQAMSREYRKQATADALCLQEIRTALSPITVAAIPMMRGEVRDLDGLATLVSYLNHAN